MSPLGSARFGFASGGAISYDLEALIVSGGGRGYVGGGGAGGAVTQSTTLETGNTITVTVGAAGSSSSLSGDWTYSVIAGGIGGARNFGSNSGACGGGAGRNSQNSGSPGNIGFRGGNGSGSYQGGAGGGGMTQAGEDVNTACDANGDSGNKGGDGTSAYSAWGNAVSLGENIGGTRWFAGGGGSGDRGPTCNPGGKGGGGDGAISGNALNSGLANSGGGGGGAYSYSGTLGGSGCIILRFNSALPDFTSTTGSPTIATSGGYRYYAWTGTGSVTL